MDDPEMNNIDVDHHYDATNQIDEEEEKMFRELLFCTNQIGEMKSVPADNHSLEKAQHDNISLTKSATIEVFVKDQYCEDSIKDLNRFLRNESLANPSIRYQLGKWDFIKDRILPLLISQKQDKKLSFHVAILLAEMTTLPLKDATHYDDIVTHLKMYKQQFLAPQVIATLIEHLADCLQEDPSGVTEKSSQMIELIVVIFRNLLKIPTKKTDSDYAFTMFLVQKFNDESVFDSFLYITQNFKTELNKKLIFHFLEIYFYLFKDYCPMDLCNISITGNNGMSLPKRQTLKDFINKEKSIDNKRRQQSSTRHSRFGTTILVKQKNGGHNRVMPAIVPQSILNKKEVGHKSAPHRKAKETDEPKGMLIHYRKDGVANILGSDEEEKVKRSLNKLCLDIIDTSFNQFVETMLTLDYSSTEEQKVEDHEKFKYVKLMSFIMSVGRLNAYKAYLDAKNGVKSRTENDGDANGVPIPQIRLPVNKISNALQPQNIDFVFSIGFMEILKERKADRRLEVCLMSIEYLLEMLYYTRDLEKSGDKKDRDNAAILKQKLFTLQL
jgi:hypothetical protein